MNRPIDNRRQGKPVDKPKSKAEAMRILPRTQFGTPKAGAPDQEPADAG